MSLVSLNLLNVRFVELLNMNKGVNKSSTKKCVKFENNRVLKFKGFKTNVKKKVILKNRIGNIDNNENYQKKVVSKSIHRSCKKYRSSCKKYRRILEV